MPTPVGRRKTGRKHHLICDGRCAPLKVITTAADVADAAPTGPADGLTPCSEARPTTPTATATNSASAGSCLPSPARDALNILGLGKVRYVVEQILAPLHHFKGLAVRWERHTELHDEFVSLAYSVICWRRLE
ncbi:hypothetical protein [Streptomyces sp900116325]|uniref:hypothetical protein n=1 Tax=Streptomyces sp. 900116325 TaxID=3154295 RepID=UPI00332EF38A